MSSARDRARDRAGLHAVAVHPHVHLGGGAHQILRVAEVHQEAVGGGVALAQAAEELRRRRGAGLEEGLAGDHLEEIAALEGLAGHADDRRVRAGLVVARPGHRRGPRERARGRRRAGQAGGGAAAHLEVGAPPLGYLAAVVHEEQLVGEVEDEIALVGRARPPRADRLELEREVVAEGAVEPEVRLLGVAEERDQRTEHREDRRLAAPVFFRETRRVRARGHRHRVVGPLEVLDVIEALERLGDGGEQDEAPGIERLRAEPAAAGHQRERRIHEAHVPPRVAAGVLVARCEERAAPRVEGVHDRLDRVRHRDGLDGPVDADAPTGEVAVAGHGRNLPFPRSRPPGGGGRTQKPPQPGGGSGLA